jgi:ribosome-associated protein
MAASVKQRLATAAGLHRCGIIDPMPEIPFELRTEYITLDALLKATALAPSGGIAKQMVGAGQVQVDGRVELRRGAKLRAGQVVALGPQRVRLLPPPAKAAGGDAEGLADPADPGVQR